VTLVESRIAIQSSSLKTGEIREERCKKVTRMETPVGHLFQVWVAKCGDINPI
jgi:hypothetical protein